MVPAGAGVVILLSKVTTQGPAPHPKAIINAAVSPIGIVKPSPSPTQIATQESPDGKNTLTMKKQINGNMATYTFTTNDGILFEKTVTSSVIMSIPFNTWSTNDKTVFVKEATGDITNWYVYPGAINVTDFFNQKLATDYKITEITGWAADNLLIVNTDKNVSGKGFSYWFDINSHAFIQLSERFD